MFCWATYLGCLALLGGSKVAVSTSLPCWYPKRILVALVHGGGCCLKGFLTWAEQAVLAHLLGAAFSEEMQERENAFLLLRIQSHV